MQDIQLTRKQAELMDYIEKFQFRNGKSPTVREMRNHFGVVSDNSIIKRIKILVKKGAITKGTTPRSIKLLKSVKERLNAAQDMAKLPILSTIPAGGATIGEQEEIGHLNVSHELFKRAKTSFVLRVTGVSMEGAGIFDGDLVIVSRTQEPQVGDIVVALVDGANTLKRLVKTSGKYYLQAENPKY